MQQYLKSTSQLIMASVSLVNKTIDQRRCYKTYFRSI